MTYEEHKARHLLLHDALDELSADFLACTGALPSTSTIMDLMKWSFEQTKRPTDASTVRHTGKDLGGLKRRLEFP